MLQILSSKYIVLLSILEHLSVFIIDISDQSYVMFLITFFQETEPRPLINDSSTSNEDKNMERYGQVNPGYVSSRPNSLYSHANNVPQSITDYEASRPPSALTSYSNFHGQRRPAVTGGYNELYILDN